ncbi:MAG: DUF481 domain-containing protein [Gammaproteobacteria bacterium]
MIAAAALATSLLTSGISLGPGGLANLADNTLIQNPGEPPKVMGFGGNFSLGYLATHSADTTTSLNTELKLGYNSENWQHMLDLRAISASTNDNTTAEQYFGAWQSNLLLSPRSYVFGYLGYIHDRFSGYRYQGSEVAGYGYSLINTKTQTLKLEAGVGATQAEQIGDGSQRSGVIRGVEEYSWQFSSTGSVGENVTLEKSNFNLYSQFQANVKAQLIGNLAFVLAYNIQHNSNVFMGPQTTSFTSVSIQYAFGSSIFASP